MFQKVTELPLPCPVATSPAKVKQLETFLASVQKIYRSLCQTASAPLEGMSSTAFKLHEGLLLHIVEANGVRVIFGGNDGILVTIDGAGHIHVYGQEEPSNPVVRNAVTAVLQGMNTLSATASAVAQAA